MPISRRGSKWQARFRWYDNGKQHSINKTFNLKSDAEAWLLDRKQDRAQGMTKQLTRFIWLFDRYVDIYKKNYLRENTLQSWRFARKQVVSYFGEDRTVQSITSDDYQKFMNSLDHLSHSSVRVINGCVSAVFDYAIQQHYINRNPASLAKAPGRKSRKVEYLTLSQIKQVLNYCRNYHARRREDKNGLVGTPTLIEAAILSGARLGELAGLTWDDIDDVHNVLHITKQLVTRSVKDPEPKFMDTKTENSVRDVPVPAYLIEDIKKLRCDGDVLCFYTQKNKPITTSSTSRYTHRMLKRLGIHNKNFHFHSFRHSHVALLLANGVDIYAISRRLGHNNIRTTLQIYSYLLDSKQQEENKKILNVLDNLKDE